MIHNRPQIYNPIQNGLGQGQTLFESPNLTNTNYLILGTEQPVCLLE